jgi:O-antigen ligase
MINFLYSIENLINDNILALPRRWISGNIQPWLRLLIVAGVLLFSAILSFSGSARLLQLMIVFPIGLGAILLFLRWPPLGLLALIGTIMIPFSGPSNSNATLALAGLLLGLWIFDMMAHRRQIQLPSSLPIRPLLILVIVAILAFGIGQMPWYTFAQHAPLGAQLGGLSLFILSATVFLFAACYIRDIRWLEWMCWFFLAVGTIYILGRLVSPVERVTGFLFDSGAAGSLFWTWLVSISFSQAAFNKKLHFGWRAAIGILCLGTLYVAMWYGWEWNSGWLPPLAAIVGILWAGMPRWGLVATLIGLVGGISKFQKFADMIMVGDNSYSMSTRLDAWRIVWEIVKVNPILGLGPANYYYYTPLFPIRGYAVRFNSHNQYIDLIAQVGLLGLACFLWFFGALGWLGWQLRARVPEGFPRAYVYGAIGGIAGTFVAAAFGDWVIPFFYNINLGGFRASMLSWLFLGGLVALEQIYLRSNSVNE